MDSRILKKQMTAAYQYSYVRLVLNYYTLFETISEHKNTADENIMVYCRRFDGLMRDYLSGKDVESELLNLREEIIHQAEILDSYNDCFDIYEYVLMREEGKFKDLELNVPDDETLISRLMDYIGSSGDMALVNVRIQEIVSHLPVRFTKQKFFSLVKEGLTAYMGASKTGLKELMYSLGRKSMAKLPADMDKGHEQFYEVLEMFRHMDNSSMTLPVHEQQYIRLVYACSKLAEVREIYMLFQDIVNDFCVLTLARPEAVVDVKEEEFYSSMITEVLEKLCRGDYSLADEEYFDRLTRLEGKQETWYERYLRVELPQESGALRDDPDLKRAINVDRLLSGSSFAQLRDGTETEQEEPSVVDRPYLEKTAEEFIRELETLFAAMPRTVVRAVMAKVLSSLPVYLKSLDEVEQYIRGNLENCLDEKEKEICKESLGDLIEDENMLV